MKCLNFTAVALMVSLLTAQAHAIVLSNGALVVTTRNDNGAIDSVVFNGLNFFEPGAPVSDFGFQNGVNTASFVVNDTTGVAGQPVAIAGANVSGTYTAGGSNVAFSRNYSLISGLNVLRTSMSFTNNGGPLTFSVFDTFDPDQGFSLAGGSFNTTNDVFSLAGGRVGQASINIAGNQSTVIVGSVDSRATISSGDVALGLQISTGTGLNSFFATPLDGNGVNNDTGTHIGLRALLGTGQSTSFVWDLAFGSTPAAAQDAFTRANGVTGVIPEPTSLSIFGLGAMALSLSRRRRS